jgi:hypothetical protein
MFSQIALGTHGPILRDLPVVAVDELFLEELGSEVSALLVRGRRDAFRDALHFWVNADRVVERRGNLWGWGDPSFRPLTEEGFTELANVSWSGGWCRLSLASCGRFVSALTVRQSWNDVGAMAEFESHYVAVFWSTTA